MYREAEVMWDVHTLMEWHLLLKQHGSTAFVLGISQVRSWLVSVGGLCKRIVLGCKQLGQRN